MTESGTGRLLSVVSIEIRVLFLCFYRYQTGGFFTLQLLLSSVVKAKDFLRFDEPASSRPYTLMIVVSQKDINLQKSACGLAQQRSCHIPAEDSAFHPSIQLLLGTPGTCPLAQAQISELAECEAWIVPLRLSLIKKRPFNIPRTTGDVESDRRSRWGVWLSRELRINARKLLVGQQTFASQ